MHTTSVEAAHDRKTTFATTSISGHKRSLSNAGDDHKPRPSASRTAVQFQRAISLPSAPPRISPSRIVNLDERVRPSEYSQRRAIAATPTASHDPELALNHPTYGLPRYLVDNFASLGIKQIYPWQKSCLKGPGLLTGEKNLVYCAPTGGGKSLVADGELNARIEERKLNGGSAHAQEDIGRKGHKSSSCSALCGSRSRESSMASKRGAGIAACHGNGH